MVRCPVPPTFPDLRDQPIDPPVNDHTHDNVVTATVTHHHNIHIDHNMIDHNIINTNISLTGPSGL